METRKIGPNQVEVVAIQNPGVTEKPYQCENRLGNVEGIAKLFTNEMAEIEHTTCMHISGNRCVYKIILEGNHLHSFGKEYQTTVAASSV